jgi:glutaredoxin 3
MDKVKVYSTPTCHFCHAVKDFLTKNNIEFSEFDVSVDEERRNEMVEKSGQMGVPVVIIEDQAIVGFDEAKIRELLGL